MRAGPRAIKSLPGLERPGYGRHSALSGAAAGPGPLAPQVCIVVRPCAPSQYHHTPGRMAVGHRFVFNELWIHIAGWEFVIPHKFAVCDFLCDSPVRALCRTVLVEYTEGEVLLAARQERESLFGGSALAGQVVNEMKDVRISCMFMNQCTLSPLLTTEQQSDAMICPNNVRSICATKKRMIA